MDNINKKSLLSKLSEVASFVAAFFSAIGVGFGIWLNMQNSQIDRQLKAIQSQAETIKIEQSKVSFEREIKFKVYDLVVEAIKSNNLKQQDAAYVVVRSMAVGDTAFTTGLLNIFAKSKTVSPTLRAEATVATFDIKASQNTNPVYSLEDKIHVDIFYAQAVEAFSKPVAQKIYKALSSSPFYELGAIKVLTPTTNQQKNYSIENNVIRFDKFDKSEASKAEALQQLINSILSNSGVTVQAQPTPNGNNPTKGYLSLFIVKDNGFEFDRQGFDSEHK